MASNRFQSDLAALTVFFVIPALLMRCGSSGGDDADDLASQRVNDEEHAAFDHPNDVVTLFAVVLAVVDALVTPANVSVFMAQTV